jgi:integrase
MPEKQRNERTSTRYDGVYQRESRVKRYKGKPDVCYSIDYRDPLTGKRLRSTVGWRSQGITAEYANVVRQNLLAKGQKEKFAGAVPVEAQRVPTLAHAWEMYRRDWLEARQAKTIRNDLGIFNLHLQDLAPKPLNIISAYDMENLVSSLLRKGLSPQTAKHAAALVRRVMRKMVDWEIWAGPTPFGKVKMPKVNSERKRYLTPAEARALLDSLRDTNPNPRAWLMALISLHCGLRFSEIAALRRSDLDFKAQTILVRDPKSGRDRYSIMTETVAAALSEIPPRARSEYIFPTQHGGILREKDGTFDRNVAKLGLNAGVADPRQKVVFHTLRHTYASWLARTGAGQAVIADMLGHAGLEMSKRYTHLMPDSKRDAAAALDGFFKTTEHQGTHS